MQKRRLGQTEITVSPLGLGTVKFGRNQGVKYPHAFELPSDTTLADLLAVAKESGINLLDTAPAYGNSEQRLGALLQGQRHDWVITTKVGETFEEEKSTYDFSFDAIQQSIDRSLQRLKTDYLDIVLVHSNGDDEHIIEQDEVFVTLSKIKAAGKIRAYGMSTKTVEGGLQTIQHADIAMVTYHPNDEADKPVISLAHEKNKGIFIKKAFASGHLPFSVEESLAFIFAHPGVSSVIMGTINVAHLHDNVAALFEADQAH